MSDAKVLLKAGLKYFCLSYYDIESKRNETGFLRHPLFANSDARAFLDSGAFSFLVMGYQKGVPHKEIERQAGQYMEHYSKWVGKHGKRFDFYITFDWVMEAPEIYRATKALRKLGIRPTPVYHGDSSIRWLYKYIDEGHKLIGLGKRFFLNDRAGLLRFYDQVFSVTEKHNVACHGLACTGREMWRYPWYSTDSTSLVKSAGMGMADYLSHNETICRLDIGNNHRGVVPEEFEAIADKRGISIEDLKNKRYQRLLFNAMTLAEVLEKRKAPEWKRRTLF